MSILLALACSTAPTTPTSTHSEVPTAHTGTDTGMNPTGDTADTADTGGPSGTEAWGCVIPARPDVPSLGPACDPWLAPDGIRTTEPFLLEAGTHIVMGAGTRFDATTLTVSGTAAAPVVLEAADGERWAGLLVSEEGALSHLVVRRTSGEGAVRTGVTFLRRIDTGTEIVEQLSWSHLALDGVEIQDADTVGLRVDGSVSASTPVRFSQVTGPLVSTTGRGLADPLIDDAGDNAQPWIEVRGAERQGPVGGMTWNPQIVPLRVVSTVTLDATTDTDCCGYVTVRGDHMSVTGNDVLMAADTRFEMKGSELSATDTHFGGIDGAVWGGFLSLGPEPTYGYRDREAELVLERVTVVDAAGPIVDFRAENLYVGPSVRDSVLGPVAGGQDVCVLSRDCTDAALTSSGNTMSCAIPVVQPPSCPH